LDRPGRPRPRRVRSRHPGTDRLAGRRRTRQRHRALHLALLDVGVQPGDDVFVSTFTFAATANAVTYCGARPVFIDSDTATWNMSPALLADALSDASAKGRLPSAVVVVDLYGQCADYDAIVPLCREYGVPLVEDAAEAIGATRGGAPAGTFGDVGLFSFNGNKIMTTSGGGMFLSPDVEAADRVRYLATQARQPAVHYEHTEIGFNYRLSNLLAAMGRAQLERLPEMSARRVEINGHVPGGVRRARRSVVHADRRSGLERLADVRGVRRSGGA
jgi:dTDP-4-amino-4,6-dideoxygalactose transaminase